MKNFLIILVAVTMSLVITKVAFAQFYKPFSGRITSTFTEGVTCAGTGPVTMQAQGSWPSSNYFYSPITPIGYGGITAGSMVLGLYSAIPTIGYCYTESDPPVPYPVFPVLFYTSTTF